MLWSVLKPDWTWKGLQQDWFKKKKKKIRVLKIKDMVWEKKRHRRCHMTLEQQEAGRSEPISRCVSARSSHVVVIRQRLQSRNIWLSCWQMMKNLRSESKESGQDHPGIAQARSLIMDKRSQNWRIRIPESFWHQMCRPSLQHLTEWLMGSTEVTLTFPKCKHKLHWCSLSLSSSLCEYNVNVFCTNIR